MSDAGDYWKRAAAAAETSLRAMVEAGRSASQAARLLSADHGPITRSAVIGKAARLGLAWKAKAAPRRPATSRPAHKPKPPAVVQKPPASNASVAAVMTRGGWPKPASEHAVTLIDLKTSQCHMPLWADDGTDPWHRLYCGRRVQYTGSSWCPGCAGLLYAPSLGKEAA